MDLTLEFTLQKLAISLGLGLLVGLQREHADSQLAGIRTFAIIALLGSVSVLLAIELDSAWIIGLAGLGVAGMLMVGNIMKLDQGDASPGITTEVAALLMFGVGAYVVVGHAEVAVVVTGVLAVLLHFKHNLHAFVDRMGERDALAVMQFVLIALVIFPVLPNQAYGPYGVLNPQEIWLMVVLIVGISLAGYVAFKVLGNQAGTILAGVLGGLISSTATTVSYSRRTRHADEIASHAALVIIIASTIAFARVVGEVAIVAPRLLPQIAPPLVAMFVWMALICGGWYFFGRGEAGELPEPSNPAELKSALIFGAIYAVVLLAVAAAKEYFGNQGLYVVAVVSGLTDMDAITLSTARLASQQQLEAGVAWRTILIAALANLVFKGGMVAVLGSRRLTWQIAILFGLSLLGGILLLMLWPT